MNLIDYDRVMAPEPDCCDPRIQTKTMGEILEEAVRQQWPGNWTSNRIERVLECGVPRTAKLWLDLHEIGSDFWTLMSGQVAVLPVRKFIWHVWWEDRFPVHARGEGVAEEVAFDALLRALG